MIFSRSTDLYTNGLAWRAAFQGRSTHVQHILPQTFPSIRHGGDRRGHGPRGSAGPCGSGSRRNGRSPKRFGEGLLPFLPGPLHLPRARAQRQNPRTHRRSRQPLDRRGHVPQGPVHRRAAQQPLPPRAAHAQAGLGMENHLLRRGRGHRRGQAAPEPRQARRQDRRAPCPHLPPMGLPRKRTRRAHDHAYGGRGQRHARR